MRTFFLVVFGISLFIFMIVHDYKSSGRKGRATLQNSHLAERGATIVKLEPVTMGHKQGAHFELIVHFSDGTSFRDVCNDPHFTYYRLDQEKVPQIISNAIEAHESAVRFNEVTAEIYR